MRVLLTFALLFISIVTQAADFVCTSDSKLTLQLTGLETAPAQVSSIVLWDNTAPKDTLITNVSQEPNGISVEFVNLETVSAFDFHVSTEEAASASFLMNVFELGSPGSNSSNHHFGCVKQ